jgi:hypothetical protein
MPITDSPTDSLPPISHSRPSGPASPPGRPRGCRCEQAWRSDDTCVRCGHSVPAAPQEMPRKRRSPLDGNPWTPAGIVRALRTYQFFVGRAPTPTDWSFEDDGDWPSVATVARVFGSFDTAVQAAAANAARSAS